MNETTTQERGNFQVSTQWNVSSKVIISKEAQKFRDNEHYTSDRRMQANRETLAANKCAEWGNRLAKDIS